MPAMPHMSGAARELVFDRERDLGRLDLLPQRDRPLRRRGSRRERLELGSLALFRGRRGQPARGPRPPRSAPVVVEGDDLAVDEYLHLLLRVRPGTRCRVGERGDRAVLEPHRGDEVVVRA